MIKKSTKSALLTSSIALLLCFAMLIGTTFAWFTDSVTSSGNKIVAGTLKVDLELLDKTSGVWNSVKADKTPIFNYDKWEPGYTDVKVLKIENEGSLALKWMAKFVAADGVLSALANVIDVYVYPSESAITYPADRDLTGYTKVGTVAEFVNTIKETTNGILESGKEAYLGIALKMQETAGNEYQNLSIEPFDIQIVATQLDAEEDSFNNQYDVSAPLDFFPVSNANELKFALENGEETIALMDNIVVDDSFVINDDVTINGNGNTISRTSGISLMSRVASAPQVYTGVVFTVKSGQTLTLENVIVDGGAVWTGDVNPTLQRGTVNSGITATGALVSTEGNGIIELGKGAVLQNNDGANAVSLSARTGSKLIVNGGEIINNHSASGAIWGGGTIVLNSGKINNNHGGIGGAIRVLYSVGGNLLEMNGGEMNHNYSDGNGGAIWAGSSRSNNVYVLNGGEMAYNYSAETGGAMYAGYYETVKIGGTFKMHDNDCAANIGSAIRFHDHASLVMTGGSVYNHDENALFLYNNSASITGGKIEGNFGYSGGLGLTIGKADIDGVITYDLSTGHNTAYLAAEFNGFEFKVTEGTNFSQFNLKPASGYVYAEGDEAKLVCKNAGYETYWDAATSTFRLKAN